MPDLLPVHDLAAAKAEVNRIAAIVGAGGAGNVAAPVGARLLFGTVSSTGTIVAGTGFTVSHDATGVYTVSYTTPFSVAPAFVPTPISAGDGRATAALGVDAGSSKAMQWSTSGGAVDRAFHFIAVGAA